LQFFGWFGAPRSIGVRSKYRIAASKFIRKFGGVWLFYNDQTAAQDDWRDLRGHTCVRLPDRMGIPRGF
jgi:hypothetical protein